MKRLGLYAFIVLYAVYYLFIPVAVLYISSYIPGISQVKVISCLLIILVFLCLLLIPIVLYRAKIARDLCLSSKEFNLKEIHTVSGAMLKTNLSYLPLIGFLFKSDINED